MEKFTKKISFILSVLLVVFISSCRDGSEDTSPSTTPALTDEQVQELNHYAEELDKRMSDWVDGTERVGDLFQYLDEISAMEGVQRAWIEDEALVIELKYGLKLGWLYVNEEEEQEQEEELAAQVENVLQQLACEQSTRAAAAADGAELMEHDAKVCIINAVTDDKEITDETTKTLLNSMTEKFQESTYKYSVTPINGEAFNRDFIKNDLNKYQIIIMLAHGMYAEGQHWITTGEHAPLLDYFKEEIKEIKDAFLFFINNKEEFILLSTIYVNNGKASYRNNKATYITISEKYLKENLGLFKLNSIMFAVTCQTLKGNDSLWETLMQKGLGVFIGYDESIHNKYGLNAASMFFENLLFSQQSTTENAFEAIDSDLRTYSDIRFVVVNGKIVHQPFTAHICYRSQRNICLYEAETVNNGDMVDLGLSVKWANCNLGASTPTEAGFYYDEYDYFINGLRNEYRDLVQITGYQEETGEISGTGLDPTKVLGEGWRMPTLAEMEELKTRCKWEPVVVGNTPGFKVIGTNGNYIFLPGIDVTETDMATLGKLYSFGGCYYSGTYNSGMQGLVFQGIVGPVEITSAVQPEISLGDINSQPRIRPVHN